MSSIGEGVCLKTKLGLSVLVHSEYTNPGSQGRIWAINYNGSDDYVLKHIIKPNDAIKDNVMTHLVHRGTLPKFFVWPEDIIDSDSEFAYIMKKVPSNYKKLEKFMWEEGRSGKLGAYFANSDVQIKACINIVNAFNELAHQGQFYQDLSENNFLIEPQTGDVRIIDTDNVCDGKKDTGILGTPGYIAPEVILGKKHPNAASDNFSLAVILFSIMCRGNPLIGHKVRSYRFRNNKKLFGEEPLFVYDENDKSNLPVKGLDNGVIKCWPLCPSELQKAFKKAFSQESLHNPSLRMKPYEWVDVLLSIRSQLIPCTKCGNYYTRDLHFCPSCKTPKASFREAIITVSGEKKAYPIYPGKKLLEHDFVGNRKMNEVLCFASKKTNPYVIGVVNMSGNEWTIDVSDGKAVKKNFKLQTKQGMDIPTNGSIAIDIGIIDGRITNKFSID